jgi:hypothetical protein
MKYPSQMKNNTTLGALLALTVLLVLPFAATVQLMVTNNII